jgi:hypothetical protein
LGVMACTCAMCSDTCPPDFASPGSSFQESMRVEVALFIEGSIAEGESVGGDQGRSVRNIT